MDEGWIAEETGYPVSRALESAPEKSVGVAGIARGRAVGLALEKGDIGAKTTHPPLKSISGPNLNNREKAKDEGPEEAADRPDKGALLDDLSSSLESAFTDWSGDGLRIRNSGNSDGAIKGWGTRRRNGWTPKRYNEALSKGDELAAFYSASISGSGAEPYEALSWSTVDDAEAAALEEHTGLTGLSGLRHEIDSYAARHIHKQHGDPSTEEPRGQVAVTEDDIRNLPRHIALAQEVEYGGKTRQGRDTIRYFHQEKGTTVVIEEVRKKSLTPASIRKFKGKVGPGDVSDENMPSK